MTETLDYEQYYYAEVINKLETPKILTCVRNVLKKLQVKKVEVKVELDRMIAHIKNDYNLMKLFNQQSAVKCEKDVDKEIEECYEMVFPYGITEQIVQYAKASLCEIATQTG